MSCPRGPLCGGLKPLLGYEKESLIRPCFSWKTQPPPAHWSMTCTQEVGLYKILPVGGAGVRV